MPKHGREELRQRLYVGLTIIENVVALVLGPITTDNKIAHGILFGHAHAVEAVIGESAEKAGTGRRNQSISPAAKLGEQIQDASRLRPAERKMATNLGRSVIRNEQSLGPDVVGRRRAELIAPKAKLAAAP